MKYILDIKISAKADVLDAFDYYEAIQDGLGKRFLFCWEAQINIVQLNPLLFQKTYKDFRQALIKPYPYHIIYKVEDKIITVYKVIYAGRSPRKSYSTK
jgi:hypothetical protein